MPHVMVAGHVCVDLIPELEALPDVGPGELAEVGPLVAAPGGAVANTGSVLAGLGADVAVAGDAGGGDLRAVVGGVLGGATQGTTISARCWRRCSRRAASTRRTCGAARGRRRRTRSCSRRPDATARS